MRRWLKFVGLPAAHRNLLLRVVFLLLFIRWGLALLGYPRIRRLLSAVNHPHVVAQDTSLGEVGRIIWAIRNGGTIVLGKKPCLAIAICTHWLLSRRGVRTDLRIGVTRHEETGNLEAHAWVEQDGRILIGESPSLSSYHRLPVFNPWT